MTLRRLSGVLAAFLLCTVLPLASATVVHRASLSEYCRLATEIVLVRVLEQVPVIPEEGLAYTKVRVQVLDTIKGALPAEMELVVPGASTGGITVRVPGAPRFETSESVLLFLWKESDAPRETPRAVLGLSDGTYRLSLVPDRDAVVTGLHAERNETLTAFRSRVLQELSKVRKAK